MLDCVTQLGEHDMSLYFKRAKTSEMAFGDGSNHRERVASYVTGEDGTP